MDGNLDLNLLVALEALLAERNVTRAARRLHLSQPTLSAQLARLRDVFGDPLLLPAQRGMIPTPRALELEEPLHRALEEVRGVVSAGAPFDPATAERTVTFAASDYSQYAVLMPLVVVLAREAPGLRIAFRALDGARLAAQMEQGEVDVALMTPETAPPRLRSRHLFDERYVAIARRDHPAVGAGMDLDTFCALDSIVVSPEGGGFVGATDTALAALGRRRPVALSVSSFLIVPEIVAHSDMVALVPEGIVRDRADRLRIVDPPLPVPGFSMAMLWHDRSTNHPALRWLREVLIGRCAQRTPPRAKRGGVNGLRV